MPRWETSVVLRVFLILVAASLRWVCTPWSFLGAADEWDNVDAPAPF